LLLEGHTRLEILKPLGATPTATATNTFTLDEDVTVAPDGKTYSGKFTFKIWNLDGRPTTTVVTGTIAATRITVD